MFVKSAAFLCIALILAAESNRRVVVAQDVEQPEKPLGPDITMTPKSEEPKSGDDLAKTTKATTTTTTSTTTTTTTPSTTTTSTTTPSTTTTSTTPTPPTTTLAPPTSTKPPPPLPKPKVDKYQLNVANHTCIVMQMSMQMSVEYTTKDNKTISQLLNLPLANETSIQGTCGESEQVMIISWKSPSVNSSGNSLTMNFFKNDKESYSLRNLTLKVSADQLPNANSSEALIAVHSQNEFHTKLSKSYLCLRQQNIVLTKPNSNVTSAGFIHIDDLQFQAFMKDGTFGESQECPFDTPDYVPITVGCALAGFIVIILVVYLVGRRRSQARGYLSM